ncbi:MAG: translation initiation factor IF-2 subunit alpha [Candidatus Poseidoniaceae archaeon]
MARITATDGPQEGDLVVATVTTVKQNGCYVSLDEFDGREGFIFIGEIASGWVRNIRAFVREGQRLICKITGMRRDGTSYELSLKSVSEERRRDRLQQWKNEQRATQLFAVLGEQVGWDEDQANTLRDELVASFGTLYGAFEEAATSETAMSDSGFDDPWVPAFVQCALENIVPPFVEIRGVFTLTCDDENGIDRIQEALLEAEALSNAEAELEVACYYDGAPKYRIEVKAPDFRTAEDLWEQATASTLASIVTSNGTGEVWRE